MSCYPYRILLKSADPEKYRSWIKQSRKCGKYFFKNCRITHTKDGVVASFYYVIDAFLFTEMFKNDVSVNLGKHFDYQFEFGFDVECSKSKLREWVKRYFKGKYRINVCTVSKYSIRAKSWCKLECTYDDVHMFKMFPFNSDSGPHMSRCFYIQTMMNYIRESQARE